MTYSAIQDGGKAILVSLSGYLIASLFALLLFYLYSKGRYDWGLILATSVALIMLVLYVRGSFGVMWLSGFIILNVLMLVFWKRVSKYYYLLLAFLTLEESVMGCFFLVYAAALSPSRAGDASNLARMTAVPAIFWAILFLAFSLLCAKQALGLFFKRDRVLSKIEGR